MGFLYYDGATATEIVGRVTIGGVVYPTGYDWTSTPDAAAIGVFPFANDPAPENAQIVGREFVERDDSWFQAWLTAPLAPPPLNKGKLEVFLGLAGLRDLFAAAVPLVQASADPSQAYAGFQAVHASTFKFEETIALAGLMVAVLVSLPEPPAFLATAPDFTDPAEQAALLTHWRTAAAVELPTIPAP